MISEASRLLISQENAYDTLYRLENNQIVSMEPLTDKSFRKRVQFDLNTLNDGVIGHTRVIHLPGDRLFVIGGALD